MFTYRILPQILNVQSLTDIFFAVKYIIHLISKKTFIVPYQRCLSVGTWKLPLEKVCQLNPKKGGARKPAFTNKKTQLKRLHFLAICLCFGV